MRTVKLTVKQLAKMINEEKAALTQKPKEVEADEYAAQLEKHIDFMAVLKIKESALRKELEKVCKLQEAAKKRAAKLIK